MTQDEALKEIGEAMKRPGANLDALSAMIDEVLGIKNKEEDREVVGEWERQNRER
jgi:hypothetical protein